jgi:ABC-type multidrug transport system permease subunit
MILAGSIMVVTVIFCQSLDIKEEYFGFVIVCYRFLLLKFEYSEKLKSNFVIVVIFIFE